MKILFGLVLCVWLSSAQTEAQNEEKCTGKGKYCVYKDLCVNGKVDRSAVGILNPHSNSSEQCAKYEVCCSLEPQYERLRKTRALSHQQYEVLCTRSGDYCVPQAACIDGFIDKTAGALLNPFFKPSRCGINEVCCQHSEQKQKKNICAGTGKYCVPEKTCINGIIDTTAGEILNPFSSGPAECSMNEVCCSHPVQTKKEVDCTGAGKFCVNGNLCVNGFIDTSGGNVIVRRSNGRQCTGNQVCCSFAVQPKKGVDCTGAGKVCVAENLCINGFIDTAGINVKDRRSNGPVQCTVNQVCCSFAVQKPKNAMCTNKGKTCVPKHLCVNGTINTSGIAVINVRSVDQIVCSEDEVCCALPAESNPSRQIQPARECGESNPEGLEIKSEYAVAGQAKLGEFPWMVQIFERILLPNSSEDQIMCAGGLIDANKVVTAAHCIVNFTDSDLYVRAGEWNPNAKTELYPHTDRLVVKTIIHEKFDHWHPHSDIAILILKDNFILGKHIKTICLPQPGMNFDNTRCIVAGWGKRSSSDPETWNTLKKLEVPVVNSATCQRQLQVPFSRHFKLHSNFICAGGESHSTCHGDGGAPLMCPIAGTNRYQLAGVLSYGYDCNVKDVPDLYVNVPPMRSWILEHMND